MAHVFKREQNGVTAKYFTAVWRDSDGKQIMRSTKEMDKRKAQQKADDWEAASKRQLTVDQHRRVMLKYSDDPDATVNYTLRGYIEDFLKMKRPEVSISRHQGLLSKTKRFLAFMTARGRDKIQIGNVIQKDIIAFREDEISRVRANTAEVTFQVIRMIFNHAVDQGTLSKSPWKGLSPIVGADGDDDDEHPDEVRRPFTLEEIGKVYEAATGEWKSMIIFGLWTGQRMGDIARLRWGQINMEREEIKFLQKKGRKNNKKKEVTVPMAGQLLDHVKSWRQAIGVNYSAEAYLHPEMAALGSRTVTGNMSKGSIEFAQILARAGLREKPRYNVKRQNLPVLPKQRHALVFHSFRHTTASLLANAGVPVSIVRDLLGHKSEIVTNIYISKQNEVARSPLANMPRVAALDVPTVDVESNIVPIDASPVPAKDVALQIKAGAERVA